MRPCMNILAYCGVAGGKEHPPAASAQHRPFTFAGPATVGGVR